MVGIAVVTRAALLIARRASTWTIEEHLAGRSPECVAVDLRGPTQASRSTFSEWASIESRRTNSARS